MGKIKQLSLHEAQKIAAGEVVERPANIVKELLENAIDAGATKISMYVEDAGKQLIRIVDNGCGMDPTDARLCFDRHATSKITHVDQLDTITTFGFRGEALASIASVSTITLITKEADALEGTHIDVAANVVSACKPVACTTGTDISIRNLFYNVPARKKFLKSTQTEWRAIQLLVHAFCFDYPHIHFMLFTEGKQVLNCPPTDSLKQRIVQLWEPSSHSHSIELHQTEEHQYGIEGIISDHQHYRYDRSAIYLFVNKRWVKNQSLTSAVIKGYANVIPEGRYPAATIALTIPAHEVDINIHPRKEEVKFLHPRRIEQLVQHTIKQALEHHLTKQLKKDVVFRPAPSPSYAPPRESSFKPFDFTTFFSAAAQNSIPTSTPSVSAAPPASVPPVHDDPFPLTTERESLQIRIDQPTPELTTNEHYRLIGQYNKTYIVIEKEDGLFLIDQHAAHERILYEQFANRFTDVATVQLMFPQIVSLSLNDIALILPHLDIVQHNGIIAEQHSPHELIVRALPVHLKEHSIADILKEMITWIVEYKEIDLSELHKTLNNKLQAQMACKAAVKAGDELSSEKMHQLLTDLDKTANRFSCPHGRPTGWLLSLPEIERKFKRRI